MPKRRQERHDVRLGVEGIDQRRAAIPVASDALGPRRAATHGRRLDALAFGIVRREALADLEQGHVTEAAVGVALRRLEQARQQARTHVGEVGGDRVGERQTRVAAAEQLRLALGDERPGDRLDEPARRERRLASRVRFWIRVRIGFATLASMRGSGFGSMRSTPAMRMISSTRSALPSMSGRQDGAATLTRSPEPWIAKPSFLQDHLPPPAAARRDPTGAAPRDQGKSMTRSVSGNRAGDHRLARLAATEIDHQLVARSRPGTVKAGSTPRSKR